MALPKLRVYHGPDEHIETATGTLPSKSAKSVTVKFSEVLPILADAIENRRGWLKDFADDDVTISADLFEVLLAYQRYHRPTG